MDQHGFVMSRVGCIVGLSNHAHLVLLKQLLINGVLQVLQDVPILIQLIVLNHQALSTTRSTLLNLHSKRSMTQLIQLHMLEIFGIILELQIQII